MRPFALLLCLLAVGCSGHGDDATRAETGVLKTGFPGQITAGGGTSGEVLAQTTKKDGSYAGGTPGIAGGSGGNTGGAATGGAVQESGHGPSGTTAPPAAKSTPSGQ